MKAAFNMWADTRMVILSGVCAAVYGAALIAFKTAIPIIPGITEVRVGNIFPMPFGLMFGPAGAWGAAMGNLLGDVFGGTLGPGSVAGVLGNFLLGYLPYTMWTPWKGTLGQWEAKSKAFWIRYTIIAFVSSAACATVIGIWVHTLGLVPFRVLAPVITLNNTMASMIGALLLLNVFPTVKNHLHLFWIDIMAPETRRPGLSPQVGSWLVLGGSVLGLCAGTVGGGPEASLGWLATVVILGGCLLL